MAHPTPRSFEAVVDRVLGRLPSHLGPDACWEWPGGRTSARYGAGYGLFRARALSQHMIYVHRFVYALFWGAVPPGHEVAHSCDNPPCANPLHLFAATHRTNMADASRKGRLRRG